MYKAFRYNENFSEMSNNDKTDYLFLGREIFQKQQKEIVDNLEEFYKKPNVIDGNKLKSNWFPHVEANVFLSHSHKDLDDVLILAGYLFRNFKIKCFIDSTVWGYADDLLKIIDDKYCKNKNNDNYSYQARNYSTSHIHMMLNAALVEMLDKSECVIFVGTPNSLEKVEDIITNNTLSPWIYSELNTLKFLRINMPNRIMKKSIEFSTERRKQFLLENLQISYDISSSLEKMPVLKFSDLKLLESHMSFVKLFNTSDELAEESLDYLYNIVEKKENIKEGIVE